ncbi:MAG: translation initiation factor [Terrimicrobiaceae bacterium]
MKKIPVSGVQAPLQNPFAALEPSTFPEAAPSPAPSPAPIAAPPKEKRHRVVIRREKSQRGGKTVVVVSQLPTHLAPPEIENLLKKAKKSLGCGGTLTGREIELQGDQPDRVRQFLENLGFRVAGP